VIDIEAVRHAIKATGPAAPLVYVVASAILGSLFVPGAILAAGSGILFGPVLGVFVTLGATAGTAVVASGGGAGHQAGRPHRGADRSGRPVGGRRAALHPGHVGCVVLLRVRRSRSS